MSLETKSSSTKDQVKKLLGDYQTKINLGLEELFKEYANDFYSTKLLDSVRYSVLNGGKRLRAILSLITAEAILQKENLEFKLNPASGLALALELIHAGSLIHDDLPCMDDDDLRRGMPSNHKKFGEANALLAGDLLISFPIEILVKKSQELKIENQKIIVATSKLSQAIRYMISGQSMDINSNGMNLSDEELSLLQELKTGALLNASVEIAAVLSNASTEQIKSLNKFAKNIGLAFQITDDILDYTQSTETLGKSSGKDLQQNKVTYVSKFGLEKSQALAEKLIKEANEAISKSGILSDKLELIADYVISRVN